jgi:hypothetical protein
MAKDTGKKDSGLQDESILDPSKITNPIVLKARRAFPVSITILECINNPDLKIRILNENLARVEAEKEKQLMYDTDNQLIFAEKDAEKRNILISEKIKQMKEKEQALIQQNESIAAQAVKEAYEYLQQVFLSEQQQSALIAEIIQLQDNIIGYRKQIEVLRSQINDVQENARTTIRAQIENDPIFDDFNSDQKDELYEIIKQTYDESKNNLANPDSIYEDHSNQNEIGTVALKRHTRKTNQDRFIEDVTRIAHIRVSEQMQRSNIPVQYTKSLDSSLNVFLITQHNFKKLEHFLESEIIKVENKIVANESQIAEKNVEYLGIAPSREAYNFFDNVDTGPPKSASQQLEKDKSSPAIKRNR